MNSQALKDKLRNISNKNNISINILIRFYMYEKFLERLSISKYKDNFVIKGGFYLSTLFGIENRTTMDIDVALKKVQMNEHKLKIIIEQIIQIDLNDGVIIKLDSISKIRQEDEYGGFRFTLKCYLENIKEQFHFDIATGDPITPKEIKYKYKSLFEEKDLKLWAYTIETVLAEKLQTILSRNILGSRMKDYYDIYLITNLMKYNVDTVVLKKAIYNTFKKRHSLECIKNSNNILNNIIEDNNMEKKWKAYQRKYDYAKNIEFNIIINEIKELLSLCNLYELQAI